MAARASLGRSVPALAPGTILQLMYLDERLDGLGAGRFVEIGVGKGVLSRRLLDRGWTGTGYEPGPGAATARAATAPDVMEGRYELRAQDWLDAPPDEPADLVISSMVLEHLDESAEAAYWARAARTLRPGGRAAILVPGSPRHWGIEDEIAGHHRRYTAGGLCSRLNELGWSVEHVAGLTWPLSNVLLPLSNRLVARAERGRRELSLEDRTALSGDRHVVGKTSFPRVASLLLNERALLPLHIAQKRGRRSPRALVLYAEATPAP